MATGNQLDYIRPEQLQRENGPPQYPRNVPAGAPGAAGSGAAVAICGVPLLDEDANGYQFVTRLPSTAALATGLTFNLHLADDPNNADPGDTVKLGITVKRLVSGTDNLTLASAAAEQAFTQAMPAVSGKVQTKACAIANANLPASLAAGDLVLVRIRRLGSDAADTYAGVVLLLGVSILDT